MQLLDMKVVTIIVSRSSSGSIPFFQFFHGLEAVQSG
jgi:hypothetical protein